MSGDCTPTADEFGNGEREIRLAAIAARARGDFETERIALDRLALMERAVSGFPTGDKPSGVDHSTCGHINHTTLDGSRHEEMHTAIFDLIKRWSSAANREVDAGAELVYRACIDDLVKAMHPFEVEQ